MWSQADRAKYERCHLRYPSDLTDAEWALIETHIPSAKRGGRRREVDVRYVLQGVLYVLARSPPAADPPRGRFLVRSSDGAPSQGVSPPGSRWFAGIDSDGAWVA